MLVWGAITKVFCGDGTLQLEKLKTRLYQEQLFFGMLLGPSKGFFFWRLQHLAPTALATTSSA